MQSRTKELIAMPVIGNAVDDADAWTLAHIIAIDTNTPMEDRLAALAKINEIIGMDDPCDEAALAEYMRDFEA